MKAMLTVLVALYCITMPVQAEPGVPPAPPVPSTQPVPAVQPSARVDNNGADKVPVVVDEDKAPAIVIRPLNAGDSIGAVSMVPKAVIESQVKQFIPGRLIMLSAAKSIGVKRIRWYVEPSANSDLELVEGGMRAAFVPTKQQVYTFRLVVTSATGEIDDTTLQLSPLQPVEDEAEGIVQPSVLPMFNSQAPNRRAMLAPIIRKLGAGRATELAALAGVLESVRIRMGATGEIRSWDEMDNAISVLAQSTLGPALTNIAPVVEAVDQCLEAERGSDLPRLTQVLADLASAMSQRR